jgi:nitrite reductase/ring-hydroxylating ferredoxin subunit
MAWTRVCLVDEVPPGEAFTLDVDPPVAVFNIDGEYFATAATCTHEKQSLADGYLDGDTVECPAHFARFCLRTGRALSTPARHQIQTYAVRVEGDAIYADL